MKARYLLLGSIVLVVTACGQTQMLERTGHIRDLVIQRNYPGALTVLRQSKEDDSFKKQDRVVFWMQEGMLLHLMGKYKESVDVLNTAERVSKELFTKSISKGIKAAFTSDAATDYAGEDYEKVLLNVVKALNFLAMDNRESALVEARKINEKLSYYNLQYKHKNIYNQDAFALWLSGLLHEMSKEYDDARIDYTKAMAVYRGDFAANYGISAPSWLAEDIVRVAVLSGDQETAAKYRSQMGAHLGNTIEALKNNGEIVLINLNGEGPSKSDFFINCVFLNALNWWCDAEPGGEFMKRTTITVTHKDATSVKVAFPQLHIHPPVNPFVTVSVNGTSTQSELAYPLSQIAVKTMADKMHRIFKDAIIRVITKTLTTLAAEKAGEAAGGQLLGWVTKTATSVTMQATEEADKRAWTTLPSQIDVARLLVPPGTHTLTLSLPRSGTFTIPNVPIEAGKRTFVTYRTMP